MFADIGDLPEQTTQSGATSVAIEHMIGNLHWYGTALLIIVVLAIILQAAVMIKTGKSWTDPTCFRIMVITIVAGFGSFLIVAGYGAAQTNPLIGLLGAIVGYVFGKEQSKD